MARKVDPSQIYNGSAAYDLYQYENYRTYGNAAPKVEPQGLPEERPVPRKHKRVKAKVAVAPFAVVGMMVVACMLILVIFGYVQLYEATELVSSLQSELSSLQQEQVVLESLYEGGIDLEYIEARATELGMSAPTGEQTVYLNLSGSDRAEIYSSEEVGFFQKIIQAVQNSASGLVEYLS